MGHLRNSREFGVLTISIVGADSGPQPGSEMQHN